VTQLIFWTIVIVFISSLPAMHDGTMVKMRWYNDTMTRWWKHFVTMGKTDGTMVKSRCCDCTIVKTAFSSSNYCDFISVTSRFHHRTIATSRHRQRNKKITIVQTEHRIYPHIVKRMYKLNEKKNSDYLNYQIAYRWLCVPNEMYFMKNGLKIICNL
jgi:hypothetical protein